MNPTPRYEAMARLIARYRAALLARDLWEVLSLWLTADRWQRLSNDAFLVERLEMVKVAAAEQLA